MKNDTTNSELFGTEKIGKILLKIAPPVMLAQLIQALYNVVDSFFVGRYSGDGLTALSVIFPIQLIITALAVGTGVGVNTFMARQYARGEKAEAKRTAGTGEVLAVGTWAVFSLIAFFVMRPYVMTSAKSQQAIEYAVQYGIIVCVGSLGTFLESLWSKVHQAGGNMRLPMIAQIAGAIVNIALDPILIFGWGKIPSLGVAGAGYATIIGQFVSAIIVGVRGICKPPRLRAEGHYIKAIYKLGYPNIIMQSLYTVYIVALNVILAQFCDEAVTVLGLYYKMQAFFFIPLFGLQTCIVPVLSYNYEKKAYERCRKILKDALIISVSFMVIGVFCFEVIPLQTIKLFSSDETVLAIGKPAFRLIGSSFFSAAVSLLMPVFFQAIGKQAASVLLSLTRQIFCLLPIFWLFSLLGLGYSWIAFPVSETIAGGVGLLLYVRQVHKWKKETQEDQEANGGASGSSTH